jgi:hypothetical protein
MLKLLLRRKTWAFLVVVANFDFIVVVVVCESFFAGRFHLPIRIVVHPRLSLAFHMWAPQQRLFFAPTTIWILDPFY